RRSQPTSSRGRQEPTSTKSRGLLPLQPVHMEAALDGVPDVMTLLAKVRGGVVGEEERAAGQCEDFLTAVFTAIAKHSEHPVGPVNPPLGARDSPGPDRGVTPIGGARVAAFGPRRLLKRAGVQRLNHMNPASPDPGCDHA